MSKTTTALTDHLRQVLADTYALAVKTHAAHWNVTGPQFFSLHEAFGTQYEALFEAADLLAERLRALGGKAPSGIEALNKASNIDDIATSEGLKLAKALEEDHVALSALLKKAVIAAQAGGDEATSDLLIGRIEEHDKTAWMLKSVTA